MARRPSRGSAPGPDRQAPTSPGVRRASGRRGGWRRVGALHEVGARLAAHVGGKNAAAVSRPRRLRVLRDGGRRGRAAHRLRRIAVARSNSPDPPRPCQPVGNDCQGHERRSPRRGRCASASRARGRNREGVRKKRRTGVRFRGRVPLLWIAVALARQREDSTDPTPTPGRPRARRPCPLLPQEAS